MRDAYKRGAMRSAEMGRVQAPSSFAYEWHGGDQLEALRISWMTLQEAQQASPMARTEWTQAFVESYCRFDPQRVRVAAVFCDTSLEATIPLVQKGSLGFRFLEFLSSDELYEPTELLCNGDKSLVALLDSVLKAFGQPIVLERYPANEASLLAITSKLRHAYKVRCRARPPSPSVSLGPDPEQVLNAGRRSDLRRMRKRAEKRGKVTFELLAPTESELPVLMETAVRIEAAGWKGDNQSALLHDIAAKDFFDRYAVLAARSGIFRMAFMYIDGQPVATQIMVECGDALWLLKIGYDEAFSDCSPGNLLMMEVIRYACRQQLKSCEFLGSAANWTRMWTNTEYATECVTIFPGRWSYLRHMARIGLQRVLVKALAKASTRKKATT